MSLENSHKATNQLKKDWSRELLNWWLALLIYQFLGKQPQKMLRKDKK